MGADHQDVARVGMRYLAVVEGLQALLDTPLPGSDRPYTPEEDARHRATHEAWKARIRGLQAQGLTFAQAWERARARR